MCITLQKIKIGIDKEEIMCTFCGQHCVEDEPYRLSPEEIKTGKRVPENTCPDKRDGMMDDDEYAELGGES